jgi:hypothetical protein
MKTKNVTSMLALFTPAKLQLDASRVCADILKRKNEFISQTAPGTVDEEQHINMHASLCRFPWSQLKRESLITDLEADGGDLIFDPATRLGRTIIACSIMQQSSAGGHVVRCDEVLRSAVAEGMLFDWFNAYHLELGDLPRGWVSKLALFDDVSCVAATGPLQFDFDFLGHEDPGWNTNLQHVVKRCDAPVWDVLIVHLLLEKARDCMYAGDYDSAESCLVVARERKIVLLDLERAYGQFHLGLEMPDKALHHFQLAIKGGCRSVQLLDEMHLCDEMLGTMLGAVSYGRLWDVIRQELNSHRGLRQLAQIQRPGQ